MSYVGQIAQLPVAGGGLLTDEAPTRINVLNLYRATNVTVQDGVLMRDYGAYRYNASALPSGVVAVYDWWPTPGNQFLIAVTREGKVYRFSDRYSYIEVVASGGAPTTLTVTDRVRIVEGGKELAGNERKLFIFTGNNPVQVISGTNTFRTSISNPPSDWASNYPTYGIIYFGRLFAFGNNNLPHFVYASSSTDHEDFSTNPFNVAYFNVYPGDSQKLQTAFAYKGFLHVVKYPRGLYQLQIPSIGDPLTWYFTKLNEDFGASSIDASAAVMDDIWMFDSNGAITSVTAAFQLKNMDAANVSRQLKVQSYINQIVTPFGQGERQAYWYPYKRKAYFTCRGVNDQYNNTTLCFDFQSQLPKLTVITKDQATCYGSRKTGTLADELIYGSEDGYIYVGNLETRTLDSGTFVSEFQTPHMDIGDPKDKNWDFVEIEYQPTGGYNISCDVFIDGKYTQTKSFYLGKSNQLDHFVLDTDRLQGRSVRRQRLPIKGRGRTISLRFYQSGASQNFKFTSIALYYRPQGENEKGA